nr:uncharacterized protein LOC129263902 [Lytechinus pictus]
MGQSHSKRYKSRRYQFGDEPVQPATSPGKQRRFTRKPKNVSQHIAHHSHQMAHHSQYTEQPSQPIHYRRRSSQDYLSSQLRDDEMESQPRPQSWHETRFHPLASAVPDVRSRMTGNYRPHAANLVRRETSFATHEEDNITSMGYHSMERRESYYGVRDSSFVPISTRLERSEVTDLEIKELVEELRDSDWMRLGSHLGISTSRLAAFKERYLGNVPLCAMEVLLLWKNNCSEVINPRSHLALALSTVGREDLYNKIKRRTYILEAESRAARNRRQGTESTPNIPYIINDDDKRTTMTTERSYDKTESGVETFESLSDSLEDESDEDNETGWPRHNVIHVPIEVLSDNEQRSQSPKPKSITVPIVTTDPHERTAPSSSAPSAKDDSVNHATVSDKAGVYESKSDDDTGSVDLDPSSGQLEPYPGTVTSRLDPVEPGETVAVAVLKSVDGTITIQNDPRETQRDHPLGRVTSIPVRSENTQKPAPTDHKRSSKPDVSKGAGPPKSLRKSTPKSTVSKTKMDLSLEELRIISTEIRSTSEWHTLGKRLGLNQNDIKNVSKANGEGVAQCAFSVLKLWKKRSGNAPQGRRILAAVSSDLGRDDLYAAITNNKLLSRIQSLEDSVARWQDALKKRYVSDDFDAIKSQHYLEIPAVYQNERGQKETFKSRHDVLSAHQRGKQQPPFILLHGDAGCGKTGLLKRLALDWAEGNEQSPLSKVPLVLFFTLGELRRCRSIGEAVVKHLLFTDASTTTSMVDDYLRMHPKNSVLLIDGFDVSRSQGDLRAVQKIRDIVQCQVIVSSRACLPESEDSTRKVLSVEMQGLSFDLQSEFIRSFFESDEARGIELLQHVGSDDVLLSFCSRPMFLVTICKLWENHAQLQDINTPSDIITSSLVLCFIGHEDVANVVEAVRNVMSGLSRVALESVLKPNGHLTFKTKDLADSERECAELAERVGLIRCTLSTADGSVSSKEDREWSFCHPLVHEKCAAIGLARLHRTDPQIFEDILSSIGTIADCESLRFILTFASGESPDVAKIILRVLGDLAWKDPGSTLAAQELVLKCNFECHRNDALNRELQINLRSLQITAFTKRFLIDVAFRYFILNSVREAEEPVHIEKVQFCIASRIDMDYATACLQNGYFSSVPEMIFDMPHTFSPSREALRRLSDDVVIPTLRRLRVNSIFSTSDFISNLHSSETLEELTGTDVDPKYINLPAWCRNYPNLKVLSLSCIMYHDPGNVDSHRNSLKGLDNVLGNLTSLERLQLSNLFSSETLIQILTMVLQTLPKVSHIKAGPSGDQLRHYAEEVEETCGEVSDATIQSFVKATKKSASLKILQLSCFGNFEKLYQMLRSETGSKGRSGSELQFSSPRGEDGYWVFKR